MTPPDRRTRFVGGWLAAIAVSGIAWGAWLRIVHARDALLFGDEFHSLQNVPLGYAELLRHYDAEGSGLALPLLQRALADLIGLGHWSLRVPALLGSLGSLLGAWRLGNARGVGAGGGAALLLALSPFHAFYGHFGRVYGLVSLAALLLLATCARLLSAPAPRARHYAALAGLSVALLYLHLTTTAFVGSLLAATLALLTWRGGDARARLLPLVAAAAGGFVLAALLYLPASESLVRFLRTKTSAEYPGSFDTLDLATLVGGGRAGGWLLLAGLALGAWQGWRRRDAFAALLAAGIVGPWLALWLVRPYGDAYAYARYLMPSAALLAILCVRALAQIPAPRHRSASRGLALLPAGVIAATTLAGSLPGRDGPHANTYLAMLSLPAFDAAYPDRPAFYAELASDPRVTLIEAPALLNRSRQLYRSHFLFHRQRTLLGFLPEEAPPRLPDGPYVALDGDALQTADADFLILHRDAAAEASRYWDFVYRQPGALEGPLRAFMERQRRYQPVPARPTAQTIASLRARLGEPIYEDRDVSVWALRQPERRARPRARAPTRGARVPPALPGRNAPRSRR